METPKAVPQPSTVPQAIVGPQTVDHSPPWHEDDAASLAMSGASSRRQPLPAPPLPPVEVVHWSIVVLTMATAASVLIGSYGGQVSRPRELLPVMIVTPAR